MSKETRCFYEFGPFRIDTLNRQLRREGNVVPLKAKAIDTLLLLIRHRGDVVEKDDLMKSLWPDSFVEDANLTQNIYTLRKALGDTTYIETIPRRGYRFHAEVKEWQDSPPDLMVIQERTRTSVAYEEEWDGSMEPDTKEATHRSPDGRVVSGADQFLVPGSAPVAAWWKSNAKVLAGLALLIVVGVSGYLLVASKSKPPETVASVKSIAVLPFRPLMAESGDEYLGLGMTDALITRLGSINQIAVRPTSAVRKYNSADQDATSTGRQLQVETVLDGSFQRAGDRVRVTVQLLRVADGRQLWTDKFDEKFTNILAVEDSISEKVAQALALKLTPDGKKLLAKHDTDNLEAYELYLKGRYLWNKRSEQDLKNSIKYFQQAIDLDSNYALAYCGLADAYVQLPGYSTTAAMEVYPRAKAAAAKALELDNSLADAHNSEAGVLSYFEWNWSAAEEEYRKALALNPNFAVAHHRLGVQLAAMGRFDEAIQELKRAQELDPFSLITNTILGTTFYEARRHDEAIAQLRKTLELDANFIPAHETLGHVYEEKGLPKEAFDEYLRWRTLAGDPLGTLNSLETAYQTGGLRSVHELEIKLLREQPAKSGEQPTLMASLYARLGDKEQSLQWLERAVEQHEGQVIWLKVLPDFDNVRSDPRFSNLLKRINL